MTFPTRRNTDSLLAWRSIGTLWWVLPAGVVLAYWIGWIG
jgi:hypothetical protein